MKNHVSGSKNYAEIHSSRVSIVQNNFLTYQEWAPKNIFRYLLQDVTHKNAEIMRFESLPSTNLRWRIGWCLHSEIS